MKSSMFALSLAAVLASAETNEELTRKIEALEAEVATLKADQEAIGQSLTDEISALQDALFAPEELYMSHSSLGEAASKVYHSEDALSIGGYGSYRYKKYTRFKNYDSDTANATRRKSEWNIVRFVPYIGFKFNDWILMNTEIEFEDGGARSDDTKNYKYAIVEFSYLDFLIDPSFSVRVGHVLVPMGLTNLNHEPVAFLTADRPTVETLIIPSTWHTNGALLYGKYEGLEYYAGFVTAPDAGSFVEGRFIQQGRLGARQFTDDIGGVARLSYDPGSGLTVGGSFFYGTSSILEEESPGSSTGNSGDAKVGITMAELHATYKNHGFHIQTMAAYGTLSGDVSDLPGNADGSVISESVNGQYLTLGYDLLSGYDGKQKLYGVAEIERLDMDADAQTLYPDNYRYFEYTGGVAYYPDPKVVIKAEYWTRDYASDAKLADEAAVNGSLGFIF